MDQRAGCFEHIEPALAKALHRSLRRAVRGDHDGLGCDARKILLKADAALAQIGQDTFIMNQIAENCNWLRPVVSESQLNGIANPKTHAQMGRTDDFHTSL